MALQKASLLSTLSLTFLLLAITVNGTSNVFDITKYGAKADGRSDMSQALTKAWTDACKSPTASKVVIPPGKFFSSAVKLSGPCKNSMELQLQGTAIAPDSMTSTDGWFTFGNLDNFKLSGGGTFDGKGRSAWSKNNCNENANCKTQAMNLRFNYINNGIVEHITTKDSKNFHVNILGCKNFTFNRFTVSAPKESLNTDGIHIGRSSGVTISDTNIMTGDDCISLGDGSQNVNIRRVRCGPGHGISIGSLGRYQNEEPVSGIYVKNCTFTGTDNGVRIKTWPAMYSGTASEMHFKDIFMKNVGNPILIDQAYCPWNQCNTKVPSKVKISGVSFMNIKGTATTPVAVKLLCSSGLPCEKVRLRDIDLQYVGKDPGPAKSECTHCKPQIAGVLNPKGC